MSITADYHMHTHHSGDSTAPMEDMIKSSLDKGLKEICFTEHQDADFPDWYNLPEFPFILDTNAYREEFLHYKELYAGRIDMKFGVEVGMQTHIAAENTEFVQKGDYDFVIASIHLVNRKDPFYPDFWEGDTVENIYRQCFDSTLENIKLFTDFDVLGHIDYVSRYAPKGDTTYCYSRFADQIDEILSYLIKNDKGLDFNSKLLGNDISLLPNPVPDVLKRYKELGGKIITVGSDAHTPEKIACGFEKMRDIALTCGFKEYYTFEKRTPIAHTL
ncbi:histidinol-phosphatase HisJ family protein [Butyrivibrio sp. XPD2006]|uniref:histidinol-phosphatase HisJ family protein n=1 Tax=Butyrivibrio sp. XPD2006 TaxID=1280668 RepID=UPI0003B37395|nr:histidinol-phosphatase HisJ family protein [Butyrivibrio sp. XPD2006]